MPVIRPTGRGEPLATLRDHLADLLVQELLGERSRKAPVIFELPTEQAHRVDLIVVWQAWKNLPPETRTTVVREAYKRFAKVLASSVHYLNPSAPRDPLVPVPETVIALSPEDAEVTDVLPFEVQPQVRVGEVDGDDLRLLMLELGGLEIGSGVRLRLPNAEMAADVHARLTEEMPDAQWAIVETVGSIDGLRNR